MSVVSFYRKEKKLNIINYKDEFDFKGITWQSGLESESFNVSFCNAFRLKFLLDFTTNSDIFTTMFDLNHNK